jgi:hypothetical protein
MKIVNKYKRLKQWANIDNAQNINAQIPWQKSLAQLPVLRGNNQQHNHNNNLLILEKINTLVVVAPKSKFLNK